MHSRIKPTSEPDTRQCSQSNYTRSSTIQVKHYFSRTTFKLRGTRFEPTAGKSVSYQCTTSSSGPVLPQTWKLSSAISGRIPELTAVCTDLINSFKSRSSLLKPCTQKLCFKGTAQTLLRMFLDCP